MAAPICATRRTDARRSSRAINESCQLVGIANGGEIAPAYVDVAVKRWQEFTGQQAVLDGDGRSFDNVAAQRAR
jgi:hypothetical protein